MGYDCPRCDWESGPDSAGQDMPQYIINDGVQYAHCPGCAKILSERENNCRPIG